MGRKQRRKYRKIKTNKKKPSKEKKKNEDIERKHVIEMHARKIKGDEAIQVAEKDMVQKRQEEESGINHEENKCFSTQEMKQKDNCDEKDLTKLPQKEKL